MSVNPYLRFRSKKVDAASLCTQNNFFISEKKTVLRRAFVTYASCEIQSYIYFFACAECGALRFCFQQIFPPSSLPGLPSAVLNGIS